MSISISKRLLAIFIFSLAILFLFSCKKNIGDEQAAPEIPDLVTKVSSSVSGFVTNESDVAVAGAVVKAGEAAAVTDQYGFFEIKDAQVVKSAAVVTVNMPGYFKGIKTYLASNGKSAFFRIKLIPKTSEGLINSSAGGTVDLTNGVKISLPSNAVVNAATNALYDGAISVAAYWLNPEAADLNRIMPGDLRGTDETGSLKRLTTYGMVAVELTGSNGELLQIAPGKTAGLTFPLPASLQAIAPASIPLWYFDENAGLWREEGNAIKTGNTYVGEVSHFSFWNCDVPNNYIQFNCTVVNSSGQPVPFAAVKISEVANPNNNAWGYTDYNGYTTGAIPDNAQLLLEVFSDYGCANSIYSQNFSTGSVSLSLGNIVLPASITAEVSGTATNCSSSAVTNGYVVMINGTQYGRYPLTATGSFGFSTLLCTGSFNATFVATDLSTSRQSDPLPALIAAGVNNIGNLQACGISSAEFLNYSINGINYGFTAPTDTLYHSNYGGGSLAHVGGINTTNHYTYLSFNNTGIALNSVQDLVTFYSTDTPDSAHVGTPVPVTITEYGSVGQFISGNFSGVFTGTPPANLPYTIIGSFRVRRNF